MSANTHSRSYSFEGGRQPLPVRMANGVGRRFPRTSRRLTPLTPEAVVATAERKTAISAAGDKTFREPLERLVASLDIDGRLSPFGRWAVKQQLVEIMCQRLRARDHLARHPEVLDVPVERPLFLLGLPRTGSTFLHNVMAMDPANHAPRLWELLSPVPLDPSLDGDEDPRLRKAREYVKAIERMSPVALKMHPMAPKAADECRLLLEHTFVGLQFCFYHRILGYFDWFRELSDDRLAAACLEVRREMQIIKHGDGGRRWIGKGSSHSVLGRGLVRAFPDAYVVELYRDPVEVIPSMCSLVGSFRSIFSDGVNPSELGPEALPMFDVAMDRMREMRAELPQESSCLVRYESIVSDPIGVVREVYERAGMTWTGEVERRIVQYVAAHPQRGVHRYSPEQFGLTAEEIRTHVEPYVERLEGQEAAH